VKEYDGDLNIILILAGLLSAVTSAFTIYIHPQLQTDHTEESADLLRVILYKMDSTAFGGDIPEVPQRTGAPRAAVATLVLLYLSLSFTTASVLFSILAKQMLYLCASAAASESNIEEGQDWQHRPKRFAMISRSIVFLLFSLL